MAGGPIHTLPIAIPLNTDLQPFVDVSDSNLLKKATIGQIVKAGIVDPSVNSDDMTEGANKKFMTPTEKSKLSSIDTNAQANITERVNGLSGVGPSKNITLTLDNILNGTTRKTGNEVFDTSEKNKLDTAYTHAQQTSGNPHNVTKSQVGLGTVANERQLSRTSGNFSALPEKSDVQKHFADIIPLQDSNDANKIKKVTIGSQYIRYSSHLQLWRPSVNYHADSLIASTTYEIRSFVINEADGGLYYTTQSHQSSSNFASDLALGLWSPVLAGGGGSSPVYVLHGPTNPAFVTGSRTPSGAFVGQLFTNTVTGDISTRDGNDWILNPASGSGDGSETKIVQGTNVTTTGTGTIANPYVINSIGGGTGGSGIVYSLSNGTVVVATTGNRGLASTGTGANKTYETSQTIDPATGNTINMNFGPGGNLTLIDTDVNLDANSSVTNLGVTNLTDLNVGGDLTVLGDTVLGNTTVTNLNVTGTIGISTKLKNIELAGQGAGATYTLPSTPSGDIVVSIKGGVIQSEVTPDYTHTTSTPTFTMNASWVGQAVMVSYIEAVSTNAILSAKRGPVIRSPAGVSRVITDVDSTATSIITGDNITTGTPNGNYFKYDMSTPGQITVTSKDFLGNNVSENGLVFYYSIVY